MNTRAVASRVIYDVMEHQKSLTNVLNSQSQNVVPSDLGLLKEISYGLIRSFTFYNDIANKLIQKRPKGKSKIIFYVILVGLYQLNETRIPDHAAISETVNAAKSLKLVSLKNFVNAILRRFSREKEQILFSLQKKYFNHPVWLTEAIKNDYTCWEDILDKNNKKAPLWIRVNTGKIETDAYLKLLNQKKIEYTQHPSIETAILIKNAVKVTDLPLFNDGFCSVQDAAAQLAANLLDLKSTDRVLDCCAAPGGKSAHILESVSDVSLTCVDNDPSRIIKIKENFSRIGLDANIICADVAKLESDELINSKFNKILADVPCSATGVIRRHPDIKWLRQKEDIPNLVKTQMRILNNVWALLEDDGILVYSTCSILKNENDDQVAQFIAKNKNAKLIKTIQILPGEEQMDGFFYAVLKKELIK